MVSPGQILAFIPARGGSKSIPRKNIRSFGGHPLLAYSIAAGLQAESVDRVIVSTDDPAIAEVAERYGAEVPFLRPTELAQDDTPDLPVFLHGLRWLEAKGGYRPDLIIHLRPTSPLRPPDMVEQAIQLLLQRPEADSVRGVVVSGQNPYKMWRLDATGALTPLLTADVPEPYNQPRQALPTTYWQTGHIDAIRSRTILEKGSMSGEVILPLLIEAGYSVDIDTEQDWGRAEWTLAEGKLAVVEPVRSRRPLPKQVELLVLDFDGVLTDNRVWVDSQGRESVAAHRGDGWGLARLREQGVEVLILSSETDPVVGARGAKLGLPVIQGVGDKAAALESILTERGLDGANVVYVGNDANDIACFELVGCALVVADAHPDALRAADQVLMRPGGQGAVREVCDRLLQQMRPRP